jgi:hypothetical protein
MNELGVLLSWPETRQLTDLATDAILSGCLAEFGQIQLTVTGSCMEPHLTPGDRVCLDARRPKVGDVVLARQPRGLTLHRLVWRPLVPGAHGLRTKADRARLFDSKVDAGSILGTVIAVDGRDLPRWPRWLAARSLAIGLLARARQIFSR